MLLLQIAKEQKVRITELLSSRQEITEQLQEKTNRLETEGMALQSLKAKAAALKEVRKEEGRERNSICITGEQ